jgi:hypothetical protein
LLHSFPGSAHYSEDEWEGINARLFSFSSMWHFQFIYLDLIDFSMSSLQKSESNVLWCSSDSCKSWWLHLGSRYWKILSL